MAKLRILEFPDPRLRIKAKPVESVDDSLRQLIDDMFETMYDAPGIGLAATQVDVHRRLLVADVSSEKDDPWVLINPEIIEKDGVEVMEEGCLSIPEQFAQVQRPAKVRVKYLDYDGEQSELETDDVLLSHCVQHEIDHLNGVLFVDYLSKLKRDMMIRKVKKLTKGQETL